MIVQLLALTPSQNTLAIALFIPILGVLSPLLIARQINKNTRSQKILDWEREDKVAARAEAVAVKAAEAADLVVQRQIALDKKTDEVARIVKTSTSYTNVQLEKIHGLVNSQLTQALRSELDATVDTLALMSELIDSRKNLGVEPSIEIMAAFKSRESKIKELKDALKMREVADEESQHVVEEPRQVIIVNEAPVPVTETKED